MPILLSILCVTFLPCLYSTGARPKGDQTPLADRPLPTKLSPAQLLRLMDHLMCLEATWHNGGALARTLYSSLYMMQPER